LYGNGKPKTIDDEIERNLALAYLKQGKVKEAKYRLKQIDPNNARNPMRLLNKLEN